MRTMFRYGAIVEALTSISHIGDTASTISPLRREKVLQEDGSVELVPVISGNSIRGALRDASARLLLDTLGVNVSADVMLGLLLGGTLASEQPAFRQLATKLKQFYMLFSGGALEKKKKQNKSSGGEIDIAQARRMRELLPSLAVLGAATGNQMLPGVLKCGKMLPIAIETAHLIPEDVLETASGGTWELPSIYDITNIEAYTRTDDAKDERKRPYLADDVPDKDAAPQQMRYEVEVLAAGTKFWWPVTLELATELERGAWEAALATWGQNPVVGGMSRVGHGYVRMQHDGSPRRLPIIIDAANGVIMPGSEGRIARYIEHIQEHRMEIAELLGAIETRE